MPKSEFSVAQIAKLLFDNLEKPTLDMVLFDLGTKASVSIDKCEKLLLLTLADQIHHCRNHD